MMIYFKRFFDDVTGESVPFFNIIASATTWPLHLELSIFRSRGYNLDLTKWLLKFRTGRKETDGRGVKTDLTQDQHKDVWCVS